jgi:serine/threonine protein kinase
VAQCLNKEPEKRASTEELLKHPFLKDAENHRAAFVEFIKAWKQKD